MNKRVSRDAEDEEKKETGKKGGRDGEGVYEWVVWEDQIDGLRRVIEKDGDGVEEVVRSLHDVVDEAER